MRGKLILLTILVVLFLGFVAVKYFFLDRQNQYGRIKIVSSPGSSVFIDNVASGHTPYDAQLKVSEVILKLIPEGESTASASWQTKVKIYRNTLTFINRELGSSDINSAGEIFTAVRRDRKGALPNTGEISVETDPQGAIVNLDNEEKGIAPLELLDVPKGQHELSVFMPGFLRRTAKINVEADYRVNAIFKLAIDQNSPTTKAYDKQATASAQLKKTFIRIKETPTGFLRVRAEPSVSASESAQVKPGDKFELLEEREGWYKIGYETDKQGWVFSQFADHEATSSAQ